MAKDYYLVTHHDEHVLKEVFEKLDIKINKGRTLVVSAKANKVIPVSLMKHLQVVKLEDVANYGAVLSKNAKPNDEVVKIISDVTADEMKALVEKISSFTNRKSGEDDNLDASQWIQQEFNKLGMKTELDCFKGKKTCNVYGYLKGQLKGKDTILVEAHLDSVGHANAGSDDNASGVAGLLMIAKRVVKKNLNKNFIFFATNGEEQGLLGAEHYVKRLSRENKLEDIKFVINMDMIGYNFTDQKIDLETNKEFKKVAEWMAELTLTYTTLEPNIVMPAWGSDHVPFLKQGIPTLLTIEHWPTKTPCYHSRCDLPDHLNYEYGKEIVKLNIAAAYLKDDE